MNRGGMLVTLQQPTELSCGQTCIAMIAGVTAQEVIEFLGSDESTRHHDLYKALQHYGIRHLPKTIRAKNWKRHLLDASLPKFALLMVKRKTQGHWVVLKDMYVYDPAFGCCVHANEYFRDVTIDGFRVTSYIEIEGSVGDEEGA